MHVIRSLTSFLKRHYFASVLVILLVLFLFPSTVSVVTHFSAQSCGSVALSVGHDSEPQATQQAALCFSQAHQHCHPATLDVQFMGVDTASYQTLSTANSLGRCTLTLNGHATGPCGSPLCLLKSFFPPNEVTCRSIRLQPTELDLQDCDVSSSNGPFIRWGNLQR